MTTLSKRFLFVFILIYSHSFARMADLNDYSHTLCNAADGTDEIVWGYAESVRDSLLEKKPDNSLLEKTKYLSDSIKNRFLEFARKRETYEVVYTVRILMIFDQKKRKWVEPGKNDTLRILHAFVEEGWDWDGSSIFLTKKEKNYVDRNERIFFISHWDNGLLMSGDYSKPISKENLEPISCKADMYIKHNQVERMYKENSGWP